MQWGCHTLKSGYAGEVGIVLEKEEWVVVNCSGLGMLVECAGRWEELKKN
jgi:hypothetical protein